MKQITITVPDNCELKQDGNTYTIVEKEKKLTYEDVARELFKNKPVYYINALGNVMSARLPDSDSECSDTNNCVSRKQAQKLLAINKLMNVAKYLNGGWKPDWNIDEPKYIVCYSNKHSQLYIDSTYRNQINNVVFKSSELAKQAIEILGEETIRLALCTDY